MRTLTTAGNAWLARAVAGEQMPMVPLLYLGLATPQRYALCGIPLVWGGYTWAPLDITIGALEDDYNERGGLQFRLPAVTESQLAVALTEDVEGVAVRLYQALVDPAAGAVADAMLVWSGALDVPGWQDGAAAELLLTAEHRQDLALRPKPVRYTNDQQQRLYPGDTCLDVDPGTDAAPLVWPAASYFKV